MAMDIKPLYDELLERTVIASALISEEALHDLSHKLTPNSFYDRNCRAIATELVKLPSKGAKADATLLASKMGDGWISVIAELMTNVPTSRSTKHHCQKLKDIENARNLRQRALEVIAKSNNIADYSDFLHWGLDHVSSFYEGAAGVAELQHIRNFIPESIDEFEKVVNKQLCGMKTGIVDIDNESGGFRNGEYVVIAGRPSQGKSSLGLSIMKNLALQGKRVGLFSLEMTGKQNVFKLASMIAGFGEDGAKALPYGVFRGSKPHTTKSFINFSDACSVLSNSHIYVNARSGNTINDIENELRRFCKVNKLDAFFVDYIGLIADDSPQQRKAHEKIADISGRIRDLIKDLQVVGFVIVQLNRDSHNKKPTMANLADSTQIERDAHFVYLIHQPDLEDKTKKVIICDKGRDGGEGNFPVHFCTDTTEFTSMTVEEGKQYMAILKGETVEKERYSEGGIF